MKRIQFVLAMFLVLLLCSPVLAFQNEPDGFRGINWGSSVKELPNPSYLGESDDGFVFYKRQHEKLSIAGAPLEKVSYVYWQNKLVMVSIAFSGYTAWDRIEAATKARWGQPSKTGKGKEKYGWAGRKAFIVLTYNDSSYKGELILYGASIMKEYKRHTKKDAIKQSKDDF